jgi:putative ABC transport system ATP-binding protein
MTSSDTSPAIVLENLQFGWGESSSLLDIADFQMRRGERLFLQGPSGSGKSTLLGLLGGVLVPQGGRIEILGTDLAGLGGAARDRFRADHIGIIFQQFNLLPFLNVIENVTLACRFSPRRAQRVGDPRIEAARLLRALGLDPAELQAQSARSLSVGQQQRVAAARALIGAPEILIADEPTSALDTDTRAAFLKLLFSECERAGTTLLFVSHDTSLAPLFTRALGLAEINSSAISRAQTAQIA